VQADKAGAIASAPSEALIENLTEAWSAAE